MKISLTTLIDFVAAATPARRLRIVEEARRRYGQDFDVRTDYYGPLRKRIVAVHQRGEGLDVLDRFVEASHPSKQKHYAACVRGYREWMGRRKIEWVGARPVIWQSGRLAVSVNPELVVRRGGQLVAAKLYFSADPLSKARASACAHLVSATFRAADEAGVLDVRRSNLIRSTAAGNRMSALLAGEAASFVAMWEHLDSQAA